MNLIRQSTNRDLWDPFDMISDLQEEMNRLFSRSLTRPDRVNALYTPEIDLHEDENGFTVKADMPGMRREDLDISILGNKLILKGKRKGETEKKDKNWLHAERWHGSFERSFELPTEVDASNIKAAFKEGVLEVTLPKSEAAKPRQIKVEIK
jgi:HSP20 family protein